MKKFLEIIRWFRKWKELGGFKMIQMIFLSFFIVSGLIGCATFKITKGNVKTSLLCKDIGQVTDPGAWDPRGITNVFTLEGKVFLYTVLTWDDIEKSGGTHKAKHKWYSVSKLVAQSSGENYFGKPPYAMCGGIPTSVLGIGKHSVELYIDDILIVRKEFEVKEK